MFFQVRFEYSGGSYYHNTPAGNHWQAAIRALYEFESNQDFTPTDGTFHVLNTKNVESEEISLRDIITILYFNANFEGVTLPEPAIDPNCSLMKGY